MSKMKSFQPGNDSLLKNDEEAEIIDWEGWNFAWKNRAEILHEKTVGTTLEINISTAGEKLAFSLTEWSICPNH